MMKTIFYPFFPSKTVKFVIKSGFPEYLLKNMNLDNMWENQFD